MIFDADWRRLGVHVRWRAIVGMEITLNLQALLVMEKFGSEPWSEPEPIRTERSRTPI